MTYLPKARAESIVVQNLENETLIYDLNTNQAFCLNETSSMVYQACDGRTTFEELKLKTRFPVEIIFLALDELNRENLLDKNQPFDSPLTGMSRREAVKKVGLASMIALPVIASIVAPTGAMAQSTCEGCISTNGTCSPDNCSITCNPRFGNCDMNLATGCETSLCTNSNCGSCGHVCGGRTICEINGPGTGCSCIDPCFGFPICP